MNYWKDILNSVPQLSHGSHDKFGPKLCVNEMVAFLAGEPHSDKPKCASPVLARYSMGLNDSRQAFRDELIRAVPEMIGTRNPELELARLEYLVFQVARRIVAPALQQTGVDATGVLQAQTLDGLVNAASGTAGFIARAASHAANAAAYSARAASRAAAYSANADFTNAAAYNANAAVYSAAYSADAAGKAARAAREADYADAPRISVDILLEAIDLDPNSTPVQLDMQRVERLAVLASEYEGATQEQSDE